MCMYSLLILYDVITTQEEVRKEAAVALKKLAGVDDKDKLLHLFKDMGVLSEQASRQDEVG